VSPAFVAHEKLDAPSVNSSLQETGDSPTVKMAPMSNTVPTSDNSARLLKDIPLPGRENRSSTMTACIPQDIVFANEHGMVTGISRRQNEGGRQLLHKDSSTR
jgi:hypothetical protein